MLLNTNVSTMSRWTVYMCIALYWCGFEGKNHRWRMVTWSLWLKTC